MRSKAGDEKKTKTGTVQTVSVRLSQAELDRLKDACKATSTRGELKQSTVLRAALATITTPGRGVDEDMVAVLTGGSAKKCSRVHLDEIEAHRLRVEITKIGTNLNAVARGIHQGKVHAIGGGVAKQIGELSKLCDQLHKELSGGRL